MSKMNAALFYGPMDVRFEQIEIPHPGPGELLVKVGAALTCGTDIKTYERGHPTIIKTIPSTFGHEFSGEVVEIGEGVKDFKVGSRVATCNAVPCMECYYCRRGIFNLCEDLLILNGAYAEYIAIPARMVKYNVYELPSEMTYEEAAVSEPLGTALHSIRSINIIPGDTVVVLGSGPLGLMLSRLAVLQGGRVILSGEITAERKKVAEAYGVVDFMDIRELKLEDRIQHVKEITDGKRGADVAIEAVGFPQAWEEAMQLVRKHGTVLFHGGCKSGSTVTLDTTTMHYAELTLYGRYHQTPDDYRRAFNLLKHRLVDGRKLVTETLPLSQLLEAFGKVRKFEGIKFAIDPSEM
ncbi:MAG: alcohol dehydrogenase catalytic domain-containing protein [Chloroflexi bacterium]|jgi:L-iditol 2-dehydrogenase|nr:alcohol dehydrogenase catalytic domain-containing protein [Chloroflexota bacterium]